MIACIECTPECKRSGGEQFLACPCSGHEARRIVDEVYIDVVYETCGVCDKTIAYITNAQGGWWAHVESPADIHLATVKVG